MPSPIWALIGMALGWALGLDWEVSPTVVVMVDFVPEVEVEASAFPFPLPLTFPSLSLSLPNSFAPFHSPILPLALLLSPSPIPSTHFLSNRTFSQSEKETYVSVVDLEVGMGVERRLRCWEPEWSQRWSRGGGEGVGDMVGG